MDCTIRRYQPGTEDLSRMTALIQDAWVPERRPDAYFHVGDLYWRLREPAYEKNLWLWEEAGNLVAFAEWHPSEARMEFQRHPRCTGSRLEADILAWAENEAPRQQAEGSSLVPTSTTFAAEINTGFLALLSAKGYQRQDKYYNCHVYQKKDRDAQAVETPLLPAGYVVRHLTGPEEINARVLGHQAGWQSTKMAVDIYRRMMTSPGYRIELDIVVVAPDGTIVATCNCWLDERSGAGLLEPVSTHFEYRRTGLGRALVQKGLQQLRGLGARTVWVSSRSDNAPATTLYTSCGLAVVHRDYEYRR